MTQREWRRMKAEHELRALHKRAVKMVADLDDDFDAASLVAKIAEAIGYARAGLADADIRRAG